MQLQKSFQVGIKVKLILEELNIEQSYKEEIATIGMLLKPNSRKAKPTVTQDDRLILKKLGSSIAPKQNNRKLRARKAELAGMVEGGRTATVINTAKLEASDLMKTSEIFVYLVGAIQRQRQGFFSQPSVSAGKECRPIENRIREFVFNSLQEAVLMPQKQLQQTQFLERLFSWFAEVFKQRDVELSFKKQNKENAGDFDQDWLIRNSYQSNMPLELDEYDRKKLTFNHLLPKQSAQLEAPQSPTAASEVTYTKEGEKKLYQTLGDGKGFKQSSNLFPALTQKGFYTNAHSIREKRELTEFDQVQNSWKKSKASFNQNTTKNFYLKKYSVDKVFKPQQSKEEKTHKLLKKMSAAQMSSTMTNFNSGSLFEENKNHEKGGVFHPFLFGNSFSEIKKKRIDRSKGQRMNSTCGGGFYFREELEVPKSAQESPLDLEDRKEEKEQSWELMGQNQDDLIVPVTNIDGMRLISNPYQVKSLKTKKK